MAIKIEVDPGKCIGCEICVDICPAVFEMGEDGLSRVIENAPPCEEAGCCEEAAESCPTDAILIDGEPR